MELKPGYKQSGVGVIPGDWDVEVTTDLVEANSPICYGVVQVGQDTHDGIPIVAIKYLKDIGNSPLHRTSTALEQPYARSRVRGGDVLISIKGTIGRVGIVPEGFEGNISRDLARMRPNEEHCAEYIAQQLQARTTQERISRAAVGTTRLEFSIAALRQFELPVPSTLAEQRAIAMALGDVDALQVGLDRLIAKKRDLKQAAMQQLLTGQTRLPGFNGEWRDATLGQIVTRISTGLNPRQNFRLNAGGSFFYVTIKNFGEGMLRLDEECDLIDEAAWRRINERADLKKDDVLFASIGRVGDAYLITETPKNWNINESVFTLRPDKEQVVPLMLFYLLTNKSVKDALGQGVTGSTFKSIKHADLKTIPCRLPASQAEQAAIAAVLSDMDAELSTLVKRRDKTRDLKQAMMQELLTGKTRLVPAGTTDA
jgi:type I restriction enzyme S subunit